MGYMRSYDFLSQKEKINKKKEGRRKHEENTNDHNKRPGRPVGHDPLSQIRGKITYVGIDSILAKAHLSPILTKCVFKSHCHERDPIIN